MAWAYCKDKQKYNLKKILNMELKGKFPRRRLGSRWEQEVGRDVRPKESGT
jgi:hypothetical protein